MAFIIATGIKRTEIADLKLLFRHQQSMCFILNYHQQVVTFSVIFCKLLFAAKPFFTDLYTLWYITLLLQLLVFSEIVSSCDLLFGVTSSCYYVPSLYILDVNDVATASFSAVIVRLVCICFWRKWRW